MPTAIEIEMNALVGELDQAFLAIRPICERMMAINPDDAADASEREQIVELQKLAQAVDILLEQVCPRR